MLQAVRGKVERQVGNLENVRESRADLGGVQGRTRVCPEHPGKINPLSSGLLFAPNPLQMEQHASLLPAEGHVPAAATLRGGLHVGSVALLPAGRGDPNGAVTEIDVVPLQSHALAEPGDRSHQQPEKRIVPRIFSRYYGEKVR